MISEGKKKPILLIIIAIALVFFISYMAISGVNSCASAGGDLSREEAEASLNKYLRSISVREEQPVRGTIDVSENTLADILPDIDKYPLVTQPRDGAYIEIFSSTEKATISGNQADDTNRWLADVAEAFNDQELIVNGTQVSVAVRSIASGAGFDYIRSGKYVPDVFSPSSELWGDALASIGVTATLTEKRLAGNVAGIVMSNAKEREIIEKYGAVTVENIITAVENHDIIMGYTNPFVSSTGANFLLSTLYGIDPNDPMSSAAAARFEGFQTNIPFVSYSTLQMSAAAQSGTLDAFVFEAQQFANTKELRSKYTFTPFGVRHDNPVYALGELDQTKSEILRLFIEFCKSPENQQAAAGFGFNQYEDYIPAVSYTGERMLEAQDLWKERKSGGKEIVAVFVTDLSGSMDGEPINRLKTALLNAGKSIQPNSSIGIVTFSSNVQIALPIAKFDNNQRIMFNGAVQNMDAGGSTAMYDAILVAEKMIIDYTAARTDVKPIIFVLTDGETNAGHTFSQAQGIIRGLGVPIYTIGYNANIDVLKQLSALNEAASINADSEDVAYQLQNMFNAEA